MPPKGGGLKALVKYGNLTLENVDLSSFESLIITIQKKWSGFKYMAFEVLFENRDIIIASDHDFRAFEGHTSISLKVQICCLEFSKYTKKKGQSSTSDCRSKV